MASQYESISQAVRDALPYYNSIVYDFAALVVIVNDDKETLISAEPFYFKNAQFGSFCLSLSDFATIALEYDDADGYLITVTVTGSVT